MDTVEHHIKSAIESHGSQAKLARAVGCSQQQISLMLKTKVVSAKMAVRIEAATNGKVSRYELCPEIFGQPPLRVAS